LKSIILGDIRSDGFSGYHSQSKKGGAMKANRKQSILNLLVAISMTLLILAGAASSAMAKDKGPEIKVMTWNLYLGADIFKVVEAAIGSPLLVPVAVAEVYQTMLFTNFWVRAEAIADKIAENKPQVIGLQEVSTFYKQTPGDFIFGNPTQANDVVIDFYEVLNEALLKRGMVYEAFESTNSDIELPMVDNESRKSFSDFRLVDRDMVLVKRGYNASLLLADNYLNNLTLDLDWVKLKFARGFLIVDVDIKGQIFRFVNTHLEVSGHPGSVFRVFQDVQMHELIGVLGKVSAVDPQPIILVGDFNSSPEDDEGDYMGFRYVPPYMQAVDAGFLDAWLLQRGKHDEGYTFGFDETLRDPKAELTSRIDHIFVFPNDLFIDKVKCDVVGNKVSDMVPKLKTPIHERLRPSDHAGVVGYFKFFE
jgi:endonuclease/exonuclease/phosphatase family metal-dependent hydrolase